jgi:hypothetical protein
MDNLYNLNQESQENKNTETPLSALFINNNYLQFEGRELSENVKDFINLCGMIPKNHISEDVLFENIITNALYIEFGQKILKNIELIKTLKESILSDNILKKNFLDFADKYCGKDKINNSLIN